MSRQDVEDAKVREIVKRILAERNNARDARDIDIYQQSAGGFAIYPKEKSLEYLSLGLASEAGEVAGKVKKIIRDKDGVLSNEDKQALCLELGDVLWYVAMLAQDMGIKLSEVLTENSNKLRTRMESDKIKGSGDNR
jgi:NTP pyrophosphatase (non-canonical NTP hydrolase)